MNEIAFGTSKFKEMMYRANVLFPEKSFMRRFQQVLQFLSLEKHGRQRRFVFLDTHNITKISSKNSTDLHQTSRLGTQQIRQQLSSHEMTVFHFVHFVATFEM